MSENTYPKFAQGQAKPATAENIQKDIIGITDPNLHRRIYTESKPVEEMLSTEDDFVLAIDDDFMLSSIVDEPVETPYTYTLSVQGVNSYRTTQTKVHDESSTESEIP